MDNFAFQSAVDLVKAIRSKKTSSSELLELYIERYERLNPSINAIVDTDLKTARARARQADEALTNGENWGPLHGLPMTIKDCIEVVGMHSTWGSPMFKDYVSPRNADVVQPLVDAGAVIFGKTNIPLWALDSQSFNEVYGQTNNPWDVKRTPGGSSGGAVAALAAGLTGLEIGSDIGGSIRAPAHFCGVYGHKPSSHIVPMFGQAPPISANTIDYAVDLDIAVTGPLARSPKDLDLVMDLVVRPNRPQRKAFKIELPPPRKKSLKEYRIGLWIDDPLYPPDNEVGNCLQKMADGLSKAGAQFVDKKPDIDFEQCLEVYFGLLNSAVVLAIPPDEFAQMVKDARELDDNDQSPRALFIRNATKLYREWKLLDIERAILRQKWADYFEDIDVLLCPAVRVAAFEHDHTIIQERLTRYNDEDISHVDAIMPWAGLTICSYLPATVAPIGMTSNGLPVGVQIVAPYLEDRTSIHIASLMEEIFGVFTPPPGYE